VTELPLGWARATIGDLIARDGVFIDGDWVESKDQDPSGDVRLTQLADVGDGVWRDRSDRHLTSEAAQRLGCTDLEVDDVLVARMPDPLGRSCLFPGDKKRCVTVVDVAVVRPGPRSVQPKWLMHAINSPVTRSAIEAQQAGTTRKRISRKNLGAIELPVAPNAEQERIVAAIEEAFCKLEAGEAGLRTVRRLLKRMRAAVLAAAVTGRLVPQDPTDTPATKLLADVGAETVGPPESETTPIGWAWSLLGEVTEIGGGIQKQPKRAPSRHPVPFLRVANVGRGTLDLDDVHLIEVFDGELARYGLRAGDLLVVEGNGSADQIGRAALWGGAIEPCVHQNHLIRVRPTQVVVPAFLELYWNSPGGSHRVQSVASSTSGLHTLSTGKLKTLPVVVPPVEEQARIVAEVERQLTFLDVCERTTAAELTRSAALRRSLLKSAFEGRLVPQDPSDEPAWVLLDRIRAERATAPKPTRRTRRTA
jgi:type I restriction enzyme S subunit